MLALHGSATPIRSKCGTDGELVGGVYGVKLGRRLFRREHVQPPARCVQGRARLAGRAARRRQFHLARLPVHDRPSRLAGRGQHFARSLCARCCRRRSAARGAAARAMRRRPRGWSAPPDFVALDRLLDATGAAGAGGPGRICHLAALGPDVVDRVLDDVERRRFLVEPAGEDAAASACRCPAHRPGRRRRSASRPPTARSSRTPAAARSRPSTAPTGRDGARRSGRCRCAC